MDLFNRLASIDTLLLGWEKVRGNAGGPGADGVTIERFAQDLLPWMETFPEELREGRYHPHPLLQVRMARPGKKDRLLSIPTVRDRVVQSAANQLIVPILEKEFADESWGYRRGRSTQMALAEVARLRDEGFRWVVDADISAFFDEVDHPALFARLARYLPDPRLLALIRLWVAGVVKTVEGVYRRIERGIPQGSPISPVLANLYLDDFDEAILDENLRLVRFADDFLILCRDREQAEDALALTSETLDALDLRLNQAKTRITHFDEGFRFLGVNFLREQLSPANPAARGLQAPAPGYAFRGAGRRLEPLAPEPAPVEEMAVLEIESAIVSVDEATPPLLRTLYLNEQGLSLSREGQRLLVGHRDQVLLEVPIHTLNQVVVNGNASLTTGALRLCQENHIGVGFLRMNGECWGMLEAFDGHAVELRLAQYRRTEDAEFRLATARAMVVAKIANSRLLLNRYLRRHPLPEAEFRLAELLDLGHRAESATGLEMLRGFEGAAARVYFGAFQDWLGEPWGFTGRQRQPPPDPVNALLSYGYAVLFNNLHHLIRLRGLDPHLGFLHAARDGHPALVSDLMEEFRSLVVDAVVLHLLFAGQVGTEDFSPDGEEGAGWRMSEAFKKKFIHALEAKLNSRLAHPSGGVLDYRRILRHQVHALARAIEGAEPGYRGFTPK
ncbi:MAG: CRISPR-associated endonuclease Cas1 [Pseudomonadota bacterium]|nr:CRISPR-associated endonuclease Cas1 [Pseudomonadota bacterium]